MSNTYLTRTPSSAGSTTKGTYSGWIKRGIISSGYPRLWHETPSSTNYFEIFFKDTDELDVYCNFNGSKRAEVKTYKKFIDCTAWYHIVVAVDSSQATEADRIKIYVNGVQETSIATTDYPGSGDNMKFNGSGGSVWIGRDTSGNYFDGVMSHIQWVDGLQLAPTEFGSVDATTGEWKIKTGAYATPGTNGVHLKMEDISNLDLDSSSNGHTFTTSGTLTATKDCPSNVFATINPLQVGTSNLTFANGNTKVTRSGNWRGHMSTIGVNKGKYYWECKCTGNIGLGIAQFGGGTDRRNELADAQSWLGDKEDNWILYNNGSTQVKYGNAVQGGNWHPVTGDGDIIMIAFDATNGTIWTGNNGTWMNSATSAEITAGTTTNAMYSGITIGTDLFGAIGTVENGNIEYNFGNGYFGSTAISSAGTNASNIGIFEYDVPTGFTALSTKGLNE